MREPLDRDEYDEALNSYIDEYKNGHLDEVTFRSRLKNIGVDKFEIEYLVRTTARS